MEESPGLTSCWLSERAARTGNLAMIQHLHELGCLNDASIFVYAACHGHLEAIQFCHAHGYPWCIISDPCMRAASRGHLPIVQWCRANGCPWNTWTCAGAAQSGRLDILQWCRDNGCLWDTCTRRYAHQPHILQWCNEHGCP
jgi:hypothetical protein